MKLVYRPQRTLSDEANQGSWMTIQECMEQGFDPTSQYPTCTYMFRSLCDPESLQWTSLINILSLNLGSQSKDRIFEVLEQLSQRLEGLEPRTAAEKARPLKGKRIFPVSDTLEALEAGESHRLVSANDTHWYIDDTHEFYRSFGGKVPLLTSSTVFIGKLTGILAALNLSSRKLSKVVARRSGPIGRQRVLPDTTALLRSRYRFLKP